jgi:hypothetical protein
LARAILVTWTAGVPLLLVGLTESRNTFIVLGSAVLLAGIWLNATQVITIVTAEASRLTQD